MQSVKIISDSTCDLSEYLESLQHFKEICFTQAGSVAACHCGPGTLGVLFLA